MRGAGGRSGFTLAEVMFASTASLLLVGGILGLFIVFSRIFQAGVEEMDVHSRTKQGIERIEAGIRAAEALTVEAGGDRLVNTIPATTLRSAVNPTHPTLHVDGTWLLPPSGVVYVDEEAIAYAGKDSKNLTGCTRGANGTTPARHDNKEIVFARFTYYLDGATIYLNADGSPSVDTDEKIMRSVEKRPGIPLFQARPHGGTAFRGDRMAVSFNAFNDKNRNDHREPEEPGLDLELEVYARNN